MLAGVGRLAVRCLLALVAVAAASWALLAFGVTPPVAILVLAGLAAATVTWLLAEGLDRAPALPPATGGAAAQSVTIDGGDVRVRRLEDAMHGAQARRALTTDVLAARLAEAVSAHGPVDPAQLSPLLQRMLASAADPALPAPTIDRPTLHRLLREIAALDASRHPQGAAP